MGDGITHDPFTRRQTKPKLHGKKEELKVTSEMLFQLATKGTIESQEDNEKKKAEEKMKKDAKPEDLFNAHDFDITIDLEVTMPNTPVNVNLKPVSNDTKKDTGPKKSLNLADYKKKRGLI